MKITMQSILGTLKDLEFEYNPTQKKLSIPILNRIYKKMVNGIVFDSIKVCDGLIIDGHHRYISSLLAKIVINTVPSSTTLATTEYFWGNVEFLNEEWDTPDKIRMLNEKDSELSGIPLKEIIEMLN